MKKSLTFGDQKNTNEFTSLCDKYRHCTRYYLHDDLNEEESQENIPEDGAQQFVNSNSSIKSVLLLLQYGLHTSICLKLIQ
jgi:hypothetical protein